jgi:Protein of unknown function (DUF3048) N-terminal domain/Protein of unknown function (DUF3048) C-terminal domain
MRLTRPLIVLSVAALGLAACGGGGDEADDTTTTAAPTTTVPKTTTTVPKSTTTSSTSTTSTTIPEILRQPLTGEPVASAADIIARPALIVKIDNVPAGRKNHTGLANADIVFEEIVEGQATRLAAVFHSQSADPVGPIRSGRTQDIDLFTSYNQPLFVWSGGNANVTRAINESTLINMGPNNAQGYFRGPGSAPHNYYNSTDTIWLQTPPEQPGPPGQQFTYLRPEETFKGDPSAGTSLSVGSTKVDWAWNAEIGKYDRSQNGDLHVDKTYGQVSATNVIIMGVEYQPSAADRRSPEAQTVGDGPVFIFSGGKVIEGRWQREFNLFAPEFFDLDGNRIALTPGNTWVELATEVPTLDPAKTGVDMVIKPAA